MIRQYKFFTLALIVVLAAGCRAARTPEPTATATAGPGTPERPTELPTAQPTATAPATPTTSIPAGPEPTADATASLAGLPIDEFFEASFNLLLQRSPQKLTAMGITGSFGLRNDQLDDLSDAYIRETQELEATILRRLREYDRTELMPQQQLSYDVYEWFLDDRVRGHEFMYYNYPLNHFLGSYHDELIRLFTEYQPLTNEQDAEDYISRLSQVDKQVEQLLAGLKQREAVGVVLPTFIVELTKDQLTEYLQANPKRPETIEAQSLSVYTVFSEKLDKVGSLSSEEKQALRDAALQEIQASFIPAYVKMFGYLEYLETIATDDAGVWKFPNGEAYYTYLLRQQTTTDLTPQEIHELGLAEVARIQAEMRAAFNDLGYPEDASLSGLIGRARQDGGLYDLSTPAGQDEYITAYETLLAEVDQRLDVAFDIRPRAQLIVVGDPAGGGGYYVNPSLDGSRPGAFHAGLGVSVAFRYNMPTTAYHEGIPGHHFQIAIAQELDLPTFRKAIDFIGYIEGWALYAEQLAWEMGLYDDDPYGNVGRLLFELLRAARLVTDTGIHAMRWTREQAIAYMDGALGLPPGTFSSEVDRFIVAPAQATSYKVGMIKILSLRQMARDSLGDQFDLKAFHNVVLSSGTVPLSILERLVQDYVAARSSSGATAIPTLAASSIVHTVRPGENLFRIALRYGTTVDAIAAANGLTNRRLIHAGQQLIIPQSALTYVVRAGDNLSQIARRFGTTVTEMARLNDLGNPSLIRTGQTLRLLVTTGMKP